jgi:hypothetical protein
MRGYDTVEIDHLRFFAKITILPASLLPAFEISLQGPPSPLPLYKKCDNSEGFTHISGNTVIASYPGYSSLYYPTISASSHHNLPGM